MTTTTFGDFYRTGTIALTTSITAVAGTGVLWTDIEQGDILECQGLQATIDTVADAAITLMLPWVGAGGSGLAYVIRKDAKSRFDPALTQAKLREFLAFVENAGLIYTVAEDAEPDVGVGEDGQYALRIAGGIWTIWLKVTGFWVLQGSPAGGLVYDLVGYSPDRPGSSENIVSVLFNRTVLFPANMAGSRFKLGIAPTASMVLSLQKNSVEFGTLTIGIGATTVGTFSTPETTFGAGDVFDVIGPNPRDVTAADVRLALAGLRS